MKKLLAIGSLLLGCDPLQAVDNADSLLTDCGWNETPTAEHKAPIREDMCKLIIITSGSGLIVPASLDDACEVPYVGVNCIVSHADEDWDIYFKVTSDDTHVASEEVECTRSCSDYGY